MSKLQALASFILILLIPLIVNARTWTVPGEGITFEGDWIESNDDYVFIKKWNGEHVTIAKKDLSIRDQTYLIGREHMFEDFLRFKVSEILEKGIVIDVFKDRYSKQDGYRLLRKSFIWGNFNGLVSLGQEYSDAFFKTIPYHHDRLGKLDGLASDAATAAELKLKAIDDKKEQREIAERQEAARKRNLIKQTVGGALIAIFAAIFMRYVSKGKAWRSRASSGTRILSIMVGVSCGILLGLAAVQAQPFAFYQILKWVVFTSAVALSARHLILNDRLLLPILLVFVGATFNPIIPFSMDRTYWIIIDVFSAVIFSVSVYLDFNKVHKSTLSP